MMNSGFAVAGVLSALIGGALIQWTSGFGLDLRGLDRDPHRRNRDRGGHCTRRWLTRWSTILLTGAATAAPSAAG